MNSESEHGNSRKQIIRWINTLLDLNISNIQQLGTGAVYCQLIDILRPGIVMLNKVNWKAKQQYQYISNYKVLQSAIHHLGIDIKLDVQKLVKCKYQDNLQMIISVKKLIESNQICSQYNAVGRRKSAIDLPQKLISYNKENIFRRQRSVQRGPLLTSRSVQNKIWLLKSQTKLQKEEGKNKIQRSSLICNKEKIDFHKLKLIKQILEQNGNNQLSKIKSIVFQNQNNSIDSQQQLDVM